MMKVKEISKISDKLITEYSRESLVKFFNIQENVIIVELFMTKLYTAMMQKYGDSS